MKLIINKKATPYKLSATLSSLKTAGGGKSPALSCNFQISLSYFPSRISPIILPDPPLPAPRQLLSFSFLFPPLRPLVEGTLLLFPVLPSLFVVFPLPSLVSIFIGLTWLERLASIVLQSIPQRMKSMPKRRGNNRLAYVQNRRDNAHGRAEILHNLRAKAVCKARCTIKGATVRNLSVESHLSIWWGWSRKQKATRGRKFLSLYVCFLAS